MRAGRRILITLSAVGVFAASCTSSTHSPAASTPETSSGGSTSPVASRSAHHRSPHPASAPPSHPRSTSPSSPPAHQRGVRLPLPFATDGAEQVITAIAPASSSTQGVVQAWKKVGDGWRRVGPAVQAWFGSDGLTRHASESRSATPIGSFTLTRAFGRLADPGTALPYTQTTPADWWISQPGPLYNTRQRCAAQCSFTQGDPNEHLYYTVPYYEYAVVIDYNTRNSPTGVVQGAGSAFFLHVTVGAPTQGCVSIAEPQLIRLLRWLAPTQHPRILIGTR